MVGTCSLFIKKLPPGCTEADLRSAFDGSVNSVKLLSNRRAFVDLVATEAESIASAGSVLVAGQRCAVGINTSPAGPASQSDARADERYACRECALEFRTARQLEAHLADGQAHRPPGPIWRPERLVEFDLSPNTMVAGLDGGGRGALDEYLAHAAPQWPELPAIVGHIATHRPTSLRLKELLETLEFFKVAGQFLYERHKSHGLDTIFDLACGHGLLGVLLAYRFPELAVVCVDLEPRASFGHYREAWAAEGRGPGPGRGAALENLSFVRQDVAEAALGPRTAAVCVHACNEANLVVLRKCREVAAAFAVMPCCLPEGIYGPDCRHIPDEVRYAALLGVIAGQFNAAKLRAIDGRITNRNLICMGPKASEPADFEVQRTYRHV